VKLYFHYHDKNEVIVSLFPWFLSSSVPTHTPPLGHLRQYWQSVDPSLLSQEQAKVLNRMLDGDFELGTNSSQYQK